LSALDTVEGRTPAARATSRIVTRAAGADRLPSSLIAE